MITQEYAASINRQITINAEANSTEDRIATCTGSPSFHAIQNMLSLGGCMRPPRLAPKEGVIITQSRLLGLAAKYRPPQEWYEGDETCPFDLESKDDC